MVGFYFFCTFCDLGLEESNYVSLIILCVSSDRKYSRQVEEVDHDG